MKGALIALALGVALTGCAASGLNTPHAVLERTETDAEAAYQATADALDASLAAGKINQAVHDANKLKAWNDLSAIRVAYDAGQSLTAAFAALSADEAAAKGAQ